MGQLEIGERELNRNNGRQHEPAEGAEATEVAESLNERVYHGIKAEIISGRFRSGNKLGHEEIAAMLNVSRTPVREALERLYQEGYVTRLPRRGFFVSVIDKEQARQLYEAREALETYALRRALLRGISAEQRSTLYRLSTEYESLVASQRTVERGVADKAFHLYLASLSGNDYVARLLESVFEQLLVKRRADGYYFDRGADAVKEHYKLLLLIESGASAEAEQVLGGHIRGAWEAFQDYLTGIGQ